MMDSFERYVGQVFDRRYRIMKVIGIGGMAVVFEAQDLFMHRSVAVKMLKEEICNDSQSVKRFINESKAVAMLSHQNIVSIYDVSVNKSNLKYIVMELIEGITLKNYILKKGSLSYHEIISIAEQILLALEHAHAKGIIHRDIKPQNIMILKNGTVKVTDFGIAKLPNAETVTMTDKAIGTVFYISPEQASGKTIDCRSDLYSLGVTMYEMATGRLPFVADSPVTVALMQVKNTPKPPREINPNLPQGLEQIIMGAMEKNPDNRFQSAAQMLRHIAQVKQNPNIVFKMPKNEQTTEQRQSETSLPPNVRKLTPPKKASRSMFPVIAGVATAFLIVCCVSAVVVLTKLFDVTATDNSKQIVIPKFVGTVYSEDLKEQLESQYYEVEVKYNYDSDYDRNVIIAQDPLQGEKRKVIPDKQYCKLELTVCWGAETFEIAEYTYTDSRDAQIALREMGLIPDIVTESHDYLNEGQVIRTDPVAGTVLKRGDHVTLYVSAGQNVEYVAVPDFMNCGETAVMNKLAKANLKLGEVTYEYSKDIPKGQVIKQSKNTGTQVPVGTKVDFIMSLGTLEPETENQE